MRIACRICSADIFLNQDTFTKEGYASSCPFCFSKFRIAQQVGSSELSVEFESSERVRTECISCGQIFERPKNQAVPVCEDCHDQKGKISRNATISGLDADTLENKTKGTDSRSTLSGTDFESAPPADQPAWNAAQPEAPLEVKRSRRWLLMLENIPWVQYLLILVSVLATTWFCYRLLSFRLHAHSHPTIVKFIKAINQEDLILTESSSYAEREKEVKSILKNDSRNLFARGILLTKKNIISEEAKSFEVLTELLTDLCLLYAGAGNYGEDTSPREGTAELALTLLSLAGENPRAKACKARAMANLGDFKLAEQTAEELLAEQPDWIEAFTASAYVLLKNGKDAAMLEKAITRAEKAINLEPTYLEAYAMMAEAQEKTGYPNKAKEAIEQRIRLSPSDAYSYYTLGRISFRAEDYATSKNWLEESLRHSADFAMARALLGQIQLYVDSNFNAAEKNIKASLEKYPYLLEKGSFWKTKALLGDLYLKTDRASDAQRLARSFPLDLKYPEISRKKAEILGKRDTVDEAIKDLQSVTIANPLNYLSHLSLGKVYLSKGDFKNATRALRQAFATKDPDILAGLYLVVSLWNMGDTSEALELAKKVVTERALEISPDNIIPFSDLTAITELIKLREAIEGIAKKQKGSALVFYTLAGVSRLIVGFRTHWNSEFKEAFTWFEKANQFLGSLDYPWFYMGISQYYLDNTTKARTYLEKALAINVGQPAAQYWLGRVDIHDQLTKRPRDMLDQLRNIPGWEARAFCQLGNLSFQEGQKSKAFDFWHKALQLDPTLVEAYKNLVLKS